MKIITSVLKQAVLIMAIFSCTPMKGQDIGYYAFIPNAEGNIDRDGFEIGFHALYSQWDLNGDGDVSESEFYTVIFQRLDSNRNGSLSIKEWTPAKKFLSEIEKESFEGLDTNKDKEITPGEFDAGLRNTEVFRSYDSNQNGILNRQELNDGVYKNLDLNGNGVIEPEEYSKVRKLYIN